MSRIRPVSPNKLPEFFIRFLTDPGDTVLDIFAGSNTTGKVAEREGRRWLTFEERREHVAASASAFRFADEGTDLVDLYRRIMSGEEQVFAPRQNRMAL